VFGLELKFEFEFQFQLISTAINDGSHYIIDALIAMPKLYENLFSRVGKVMTSATIICKNTQATLIRRSLCRHSNGSACIFEALRAA